MLRLLFFLVPLVLSIFCLIQCITSRDDEIRHLKTVWWLLLILFFAIWNVIAWFLTSWSAEQDRGDSGAFVRRFNMLSGAGLVIP